MATPSGTQAVGASLRKVVWPALAEHGFRVHIQRSAWRRREHVIDVVNFQAAAKNGEPLYLGPVGVAPLGTFAVNLGTYFTFRSILPFAPTPFSALPDPERPEEWRCDFRTRLRRIAHAPDPRFPAEYWPVRTDGTDADRAVYDALDAVRVHGLAWFSTSGDLESIFNHYGRACDAALQNRKYQDPFFRQEDVFVAAAIALDRLEEAIHLYEAIVDREVDPRERAEHERQERRRMRRKPNPRAPLLHVPLPYWHDEACSRLEALRRLRTQ